MGVTAMRAGALASPLAASDRWYQPYYEIRVRGTKYLWGSAGISDRTFANPLVLHIRNDPFGEVIRLGTQAAGAQTPIGTLQPGECVSIQVQGIGGVYATCTLESVVHCLIKE
jgi:hypothetical protein